MIVFEAHLRFQKDWAEVSLKCNGPFLFFSFPFFLPFNLFSFVCLFVCFILTTKEWQHSFNIQFLVIVSFLMLLRNFVSFQFRVDKLPLNLVIKEKFLTAKWKWTKIMIEAKKKFGASVIRFMLLVKLCCYDYTYKSIMLKCVDGLALL